MRSLCTYDWCPVSKMIGSFGESNTLCIASVSSTTPRFGPRCPPVRETFSIRNARISAASCSSCSRLRASRSRGPEMDGRSDIRLPLRSSKPCAGRPSGCSETVPKSIAALVQRSSVLADYRADVVAAFSQTVTSPQWRAAAEAWISRRLAERGMAIVGPIRPAARAAVVDTADGSHRRRRRCGSRRTARRWPSRARLQRAIHGLAPEAVQEPIAVAPEYGWMLTARPRAVAG